MAKKEIEKNGRRTWVKGEMQSDKATGRKHRHGAN